MSTKYIQLFMAEYYSDEQLAALLAHTQDGILSHSSCCCFIGIPTATHSLKPARTSFNSYGAYWEGGNTHHVKARLLMYGVEAEEEFGKLGECDAERREKLKPLILAEMNARTASRNVIEDLQEAVRNAEKLSGIERQEDSDPGDEQEDLGGYHDPAEDRRFA